MAIAIWVGQALPEAQVSTAQVTAYDAATEYRLEVAGLVIASAIAAGTINDTATALAAAWEASASPYAEGITATAATDTVTLTGTSGVPFTATSSVSGGTGTIGAVATPTAATGPGHWSEATNWSGGSVPGASDDAVIPAGAPPIAWIPAATQTIASLLVEEGAPRIGLDSERVAISADALSYAATRAPEYRQIYLEVSCARITYGYRPALERAWSSGRHMIHQRLTASASTLDVMRSPASSADSGRPALRFLADHANASVYVRATGAGGMGIGVDAASEVATVGGITIADRSTASQVRLGMGTTLGSWTQSGGLGVLRAVSGSTVTLIAITGGTLVTEGDGWTATTLTIDGGTVELAHTRPAAAAIVGTVALRGGTLDLTTSSEPRTIGALTETGGTLVDNPAVTLTTYTRGAGLKRIG